MMVYRITFTLLVLFLLVAGIVNVLHLQLPQKHSSQTPFEPALTQCKVLKVYDGDTIACDINHNGKIDGKGEHVRMLGINASEMHWSPKNKIGKDEPLAKEAYDYVIQATLNKPVYLEFDIEKIDKYDRLLAYVYLDPDGHQMLNKLLLENNLAHVLFIRANRRYEPMFRAVEAR